MYEMSEGDFAAGVRTRLEHAMERGDFGNGLRTAPKAMITADFATGMRALPTLLCGRGNFATGQRGASASPSRRAGRARVQDASPHWRAPEPAGMPGRS
jgi:hypothetical protein